MNIRSENPPLVSVVVLCYNQEQFVIETLESIQEQTYDNIQLIIADDASIDNSTDVIGKWINTSHYPCIFIKHKVNKGICKTLNETLDVCEGSYCQFIASDDILLKDKISNQVEILERQEMNTAAIFSDAFYINSKGMRLYGRVIQDYRKFLVPEGDIFDDLLMNHNYIPTMTLLIRTKVLKKIGGFDEQLFYEDYDICLRISNKYKFKFMEEATAEYRISQNTTSKNYIKEMICSDYFIFKKWLNKQKYENFLKDKMKKIIRKFYLNGDIKTAKYLMEDYMGLYKKSPILFYFIKYKIPYVIYDTIECFYSKTIAKS